MLNLCCVVLVTNNHHTRKKTYESLRGYASWVPMDESVSPVWPEGLGLNRGFMSAYDNTWIVKSMMKRKSGMEALRDLRERMYVAMRDVSSRDAKSVFTSGVIKGDTSLWSADPSTRYRGFA